MSSGTVKVSADHFRVMIFSLVSVATKVFAMSAREQPVPCAGSPHVFSIWCFYRVTTDEHHMLKSGATLGGSSKENLHPL